MPTPDAYLCFHMDIPLDNLNHWTKDLFKIGTGPSMRPDSLWATWPLQAKGCMPVFSKNPHIKHMFKYMMMLFVSIIKIKLILDGEMSF